ncbi:MAG: hypothetical protein GY861_06020 [bacterium]|nr:hypothetical protein [bacterium]
MSENDEQTSVDATIQDTESKNEETPVTSKDIDLKTKKKPHSPSDKLLNQKTKDIERKQFLHGLAFFSGLIVFWGFTMWTYLRVHGVDWFAVYKSDEEFQAALLVATKLDFIGDPDNLSPAILIVEIWFWSIFGVIIRTIYRASIVIRRHRFNLIDYTVRVVGDLMIAFGITIAVMFFLRFTTITIAGAEFNFSEISFETFAAITFILAFYYEDTLRLLGGFKERIITSAGQELDKGSTENNKEK